MTDRAGHLHVPRFGATARVLHWAFGLGYLALLASGLPLMILPLRGAIRDYSATVGVRLHLALAVLWVLAIVVVMALGDRRRLAATWRELSALGRDDARWLARFPRWLTGGSEARRDVDRHVGRFNGGQKANALFTVATSAALLASGLALIPLDGQGTTAALLATGPSSVGWWRAAHGWLTVLVLVPLAGHVFLALVHPPTRPALAGILGGRVDRRWADEHHPRWRPPDEVDAA